MRCRMRKPRELKVRRYAARMNELYEYLAVFSGAKANDKIGETGFNGIIFNSIPSFWVR